MIKGDKEATTARQEKKSFSILNSARNFPRKKSFLINRASTVRFDEARGSKNRHTNKAICGTMNTHVLRSAVGMSWVQLVHIISFASRPPPPPPHVHSTTSPSPPPPMYPAISLSCDGDGETGDCAI